MEINTPHFNAIANQFLTEAKKSNSAKSAKKDKKHSSKKAGAALKKLRKSK